MKQVQALARRTGGGVAFLVQDGEGSVRTEGISIIDTGRKFSSRQRRATSGAWRMFRAVRAARPAVAHFHDPELIPVGLALKLFGIKVIYDVHEDVPRQILRKHWIPALLRRPIAWAASFTEWIGARVFDAIVPATPKIAERFPAAKTVVVQNFPILDELVVPDPQPYAARASAFAYVGGITRERGIMEMLHAMKSLPANQGARLELAGAFTPANLEEEARASGGWARVRFHGWADRPTVARLLGGCRAGFILLHPNGRYEDSYPVKMFEYMAAGLPVITSDFPLWRHIVEGAGCGLLVDPLDPQAIADAMQWILDHPAEAEEMGRRGRQAVVEKYNWEAESRKLIALYERLLFEGNAS
ncbi:MAG: glycosyltransferase family 4 protein [Algiphilus sp.]